MYDYFSIIYINFFDNIINEKNKDALGNFKNKILEFIGVTVRTPLTVIFKILITLLSILRYIAFFAFDFSLIVFGGYLAINGVVFSTIGDPANYAVAKVETAEEAEETVDATTVNE